MSRHGLQLSVSGCRMPPVGRREWRISATSPSQSLPIDRPSNTVGHGAKPANPKSVNSKQISSLSSVRQKTKPNGLIFLIVSFLGAGERRFSTRCVCQVRSALYRPNERPEAGLGLPCPALVGRKSSLRTKLEGSFESVRCLERSSQLHPHGAFRPAQRRLDGPHETVVIELA